MKTVKRKFKCVGCGYNRPCILETAQEPMPGLMDEMLIDDLKCVLDSTNQTSYDWKEIELS